MRSVNVGLGGGVGGKFIYPKELSPEEKVKNGEFLPNRNQFDKWDELVLWLRDEYIICDSIQIQEVKQKQKQNKTKKRKKGKKGKEKKSTFQ